MINKKLIMIGGGGHCKSCIDVIEEEGQYQIVGILDQEMLVGNEVLGYKIIGTDNEIQKYIDLGYWFLVTVGQTGSPSLRKKLFSLLQKHHAKIATIVSPRAYVSKYASLGEGTIIMHDVLINVDAAIGVNCIINTKALIEHDAKIESHCHISTAAVVNGGIVVKEGTFWGSNTVGKEYTETRCEEYIKAGILYKGQL